MLLTIRSKDALLPRGHNAIKQCQIGAFRLRVVELIIGSGNRLREEFVDMGAQRSEQLIENVEHVILRESQL